MKWLSLADAKPFVKTRLSGVPDRLRPVSAIGVLLLAPHLNRGWLPHDNGAIGQSPESAWHLQRC